MLIRLLFISFTMVFMTLTVSSCWCGVEDLDLLPQAGISPPGNAGAKGGITTIALGVRIEFKDWCPPDHLVAKLRDYESKIDAEVLKYERSKRTKTDFKNYTEMAGIYQNRIATVIANEQAIAGANLGKAHTAIAPEANGASKVEVSSTQPKSDVKKLVEQAINAYAASIPSASSTPKPQS